jgi:hypothetical protein
MMAADTRAPDRSPRFIVTSYWIDLYRDGRNAGVFLDPLVEGFVQQSPVHATRESVKELDEGLGNFS